jgi:hypothetical protein
LTLSVLADAGMSSLTYHAIAAKSGISTSALQANGPTRIDAITDALNELSTSRPIPDTGDLVTDLGDDLHEPVNILTTVRARQVLGALIAEAASNPELSSALRSRVVEPRRATVAARLDLDSDQLAIPVAAAVDILTGPIYQRPSSPTLPLTTSSSPPILGVLLARPAGAAQP